MQKLALGIGIILVLLIGVVLLTDDKGMKSDLLNYTKDVTTVAVVMNGPIGDDGWSTAHYRAFESIKDDLNLRMIYKENIPPSVKAIPVIQEVIADGAKIVFATSFGFGAPIVGICEQYPKVSFYHCTGIEERPNVATYMGRMYQMRYLSGLAAGMQTTSNHIGYVAAMRIDEVVRGINAFALGVRKVNPEAVVHVVWTDTWMDYDKEFAAARGIFEQYPIDVVAYHQDSEGVIKAAEESGIAAIGYNVDKSVRFPRTTLTSPVWNWASFYRKAIMSVLEGDFKGRHYWEGVDTGIVDLASLADFAKPALAEVIAREKARLIEGGWDVFFGPIKDSTGMLRVEAGTSISDHELLSGFDWMVEGVVEEKR